MACLIAPTVVAVFTQVIPFLVVLSFSGGSDGRLAGRATLTNRARCCARGGFCGCDGGIISEMFAVLWSAGFCGCDSGWW